MANAITTPTGKYFYGLGRRKSATARARLYDGKGSVTVNGKTAEEYLSGNKSLLAEITDPLALVGKQNDYDVTIVVNGGGLSGQVDANTTNAIVAFVDGITAPLLVPFYGLFNVESVSAGSFVFEGYTLLAILGYSLLTAGAAKIASIIRY